MTRRFTARTVGVFAALLLASCIGDSTGPNEARSGRINIAPNFDVRGIHSVDVNRVLVRFTHPNSIVVVYDTIVPFPANQDTLDLKIIIPINGQTEQFLMTILMIDDVAGAADTVFKAGPTLITATAGAPPPTPTPVTFTYVGTGAKAMGVRFLTAPTSVLFGDTVLFTAEAFDSNNVTIPGTPIIWSSSDTTRAKIPKDSIGRVIGGIARGPVTITAALLTPPTATSPLQIQPKPNAVLVQGGSGQTGGVGSPLAQPVTVRVNAADNLGVANVIVNFAVVTGGGTLSQLVDTTDVNGDASAIWTLGASLGAQSVSATVPAVTTGGSVTVPATGVVGTPKKLAFLVQPSTVAAGAVIAPPVTVTAQDTFGNTVASFTGNITVAIGTNPGGATLGGTAAVAAVAGVATFSNLALNNIGTGYTLTAAATGLTGATSTAFNVAGGVPTQLFIVQQPTNTLGSGTITPAITVEIRDAFNVKVPTATNTVTVAIAANPSAGVLSGTVSVAAVAGVATFNSLSINNAGTGYTLAFASTGLTSATSNSFDISAGPATSLGFTTQPPASAVFQSPFVTVVTAKDAGGNVASSYTGAVTLAIGTNPAGGTLSGTTTVNAVAGVATFSGISVDNIGAAYTLTANATGLAGTASGGLSIVAPANGNAWINPAGGNWSTAANWSKGTVPNTTDTVFIRQSGSYIVNLDVNATVARLDVGAPLGNQTLKIAANTLTMAGDGAFTATGKLDLSGGNVGGPGTLDIFGALDWTSGNFQTGSGTTRVNAGGTFTTSGVTTRILSAYTLEVAGTGTVSGTFQLSTGSLGTLRVQPTGVLNVTGDPSFVFNLGGTPSVFDNLGTVNRTTSAGPFVVSMPLGGGGAWNVQAGILELQGGGTSNGAFAVTAGAQVKNSASTLNLGAASSVSGAGDVQFSGGTVNTTGGWNVTGNTVASGGTFNYNGASGNAASLGLAGGTIGGSGILNVSTVLAWNTGNFTGAGGTARVQAGGSLNISGNAARNLSAYSIELSGTGVWTGTNQVHTGSGSVLKVQAGATLDIQGDATFLFDLGGTPTSFQNLGTITRTVSAGPMFVSAFFDNDGVFAISTGTVTLVGGTGAGTADGTYSVAAPAILDFNGGTHNLGATGNVTGAGLVRTSGSGIVNAAGGWGVTGVTRTLAGTLNFNTNATIPTLDIAGGVLGGTGTVSISGVMTWSAGSLSGGNGRAVVLNGGTLAVTGSGARNLSAYTLEVAGSGTWNTTTSLVSSGSSAVLRIPTGGVLDVQGDFGMTFNLGGAPSAVNVAGGTLLRSTSANPVVFSMQVNDSGTVQVNTGTLQLDGGGTSSGNYIINGTSTLSFGGNTHSLSATSAVSGAGTSFVQVPAGIVNASGNWGQNGTTRVNGGTANFNGATMFTSALDFSAGTLGGSAAGVMDVSAALTWTGGNFSGAGGTTQVSGTGSLSISGNTARNMQNYTLELGTSGGVWTGNPTISTGSGAVFRVAAGGLLDIRGDPVFAFNLGGAPSLFENQGTIVRSTSAGVATISAPFNTLSLLNVSSGSMSATQGGTLDGSVVLGGGPLVLAGGTFTMIPGLVVSGANQLQLTAAILAGLPGATDTAKVANLAIAAGTLANTVGTVLVTSAANWSSGALQGGGKLLIPSGSSLNISGTTGRNLQNYRLENAGTTTISGAMTINSGAAAVLRNLAGGNFAVNAAASFLFNLGGGASLFDNQGSLTVAPGVAATFTTSATFNNSNSLIISNGTLSLTGGGTESGPINIASGAFIDYAAGTHTLNNGLVTSGAGTARLQGGTITNATAADSARFVNLQLNGGVVNQVGGMLVVGGTLDWAGGANIQGTGTVAGNNVLTFTGTAGRNLTNGVFENRGNLTWSGNFTLNSGSNAVLRNGPGRLFVLSGDGTYLFNQGGGQSFFDNQGTFQRTTSTNPVGWSAQYIDTVGQTSILTGTFQLGNGGRLATGTGKSVAASAALELTAGTLTFKAGTSVTGAGKIIGTGGTMTPDSNSAVAPAATNAVNFANFDLNGSTLTHEGLLQVTGIFNWNSGNITSNTTGLGGTTRGTATSAVNFLGTAGRNLVGLHTLEILGTGTWSGAFTMSTGSGSTLRVQSGASLNVSAANPTISYNQGGAAPVLNNLGAITRSTGALNWVVNEPVSGNGTWAVTGGTLDFQGGGTIAGATTVATGTQLVYNSNLTVTAPVTGAGTGAAFVTGGTVNYNTTMNIPTLTLSGGTFAMGGQPVTVTGNFSTSGTGALSMTNATDSLDIAGSASFGGNTGVLQAGVIRVGGNFIQTGSTSFQGTAQSAAVAHRVRLVGGNATISFADPVNSFFRRLIVASNAGTSRTMTSNVRTTFFSLQGGTYSFTGSAGPITRLTADTVAGASSGSVSMQSPMVLVVNDAMLDSNVVNVDTVVYAGTSQNIRTTAPGGFGNYTYKSVRIAQAAGTANLQQNTNLTNDLVVSSGILSLNSFHVGVTGNFRTETGGSLQMTNASDSLGVAGSVTFNGGPTATQLTTGILEVKGSFVQSGAINSFAPSGTHRTRFNLPGSGVIQQISFASPTTSFFDSLDLNRGTGTRGTVNFQTDARINRGLSIQNSTDVTGPTARITIAGGSLTASQSTTSPTMLTTRALELALTPPQLANMVGAVNISPDTVVFNPGIATLPTASGVRYNSIRVSTGTTFTMATDSINADLHVALGTATFSAANTFLVNGKLRTTGAGAFSMTNAGANVTVVDSALFGGGASTALTQGTLRLRGNFVQTGTSSFQASLAHVTVFENTTRKTISMASPGTLAGNSRFAQLEMDRPGGLSVALGLLTNIQVGLLRDTAAGQFDSIFGTTTQVVTADSMQISNMVFDRAPLVLTATGAANSGATVRWQNMDPTTTYFSLTRTNTSIGLGFSNVVFATVRTTGRYFSVTTTGSIATGAFVSFTTSTTPGTMLFASGDYFRGGTQMPTISWNGASNP